MEDKDKELKVMDVLIAWGKKDSIMILVAFLAMLACLYTLVSVQGYQVAINDHWERQWGMSGCKAGYTPANISWNWRNQYGDEDTNQYPEGLRTQYS